MEFLKTIKALIAYSYKEIRAEKGNHQEKIILRRNKNVYSLPQLKKLSFD